MTNVSNHDHQSLTSLGNVTTWFRVEQPLFTCSKHTSHTIQQNKRHLTSCSWLFIILLEVTRHSGHLWKKHINTTQQLEKHSPFNNNNNFYQYITHMTFSFLSFVFQNKANNFINLKKPSDSPDLLFLSHLQNILFWVSRVKRGNQHLLNCTFNPPWLICPTPSSKIPLVIIIGQFCDQYLDRLITEDQANKDSNICS